MNFTLLLADYTKHTFVLNHVILCVLPQQTTWYPLSKPAVISKKSCCSKKTFLGAKKTFFLVNGSTSGIYVSIFSCIRLHQMRMRKKSRQETDAGKNCKDSIVSDQRSIFLVCRDSHKSVFDALYLAGNCDAITLPCEYDDEFQISLGISSDFIRNKLGSLLQEFGDRICGLILTRPTYQGVLLESSQLKKIINLFRIHP